MHPSPSPFASTVFCSISNATELLFSYNGGGSELEPLAYVWLKKVPLHHAWCSHTTPENRTLGFLMEDGYTYFAISNGTGNLESHLFLTTLRDVFMKMPKTTGMLQAEMDALVHGLIHGSDNGGLKVGRPAREMQLEANLLSPRGRKKGRDRGTDLVVDHNLERGLKIDIDQEHGFACGGGIVVAVASRRSSSSKLRALQQNAQKQWRRHVKVVITIDAALCLLLLAAWLAVCRGLQCVAASSS